MKPCYCNFKHSQIQEVDSLKEHMDLLIITKEDNIIFRIQKETF